MFYAIVFARGGVWRAVPSDCGEFVRSFTSVTAAETEAAARGRGGRVVPLHVAERLDRREILAFDPAMCDN